MRFYLGTHEPTWLSKSHVPLFVSAVRLRERCRVKLPTARVPWALDSGGFSVLSKHGGYPTTNAQYAGEVTRWAAGIGQMDWAAVQDWMCEPQMLARTGLTVAEHQRRTVESYVELRALAPSIPWVPVLQGYEHAEYLRCADLYAAAGFDLTQLPTVGIGSVCRREDTTEAERIIHDLAGRGFNLHGFGFKIGGVERCRAVLASADSLAWSYGARRRSSEARKAAATPGLFGAEAYQCKGGQNAAGEALEWNDKVRTAAAITPETGLAVCPFCDSLDVSFPVGGSTDYACVNCGECWGDVRQPALS